MRMKLKVMAAATMKEMNHEGRSRIKPQIVYTPCCV